MVMIMIPLPVLATPVNVNEMNSRILELNKRFSSLESTWGRFQMGGNLTLQSDALWKNTPNEMPLPAYNQELELYFDAGIDENFQFSLRLNHTGGWGFNYLSMDSGVYPMNSPLQVTEAFLRYEKNGNYDYLGRFRFTLGPLGLINDFIVNPVEGFALQHKIGPFYLSGLYSRVNTQYKANTNQVDSS
jgi:hypothetical protein